MSVSEATLKCAAVLQLWNVCQSHNSGISLSPAILECPSVPQLLDVRQSRHSGTLVSPALLGSLSVLQLLSGSHSRDSWMSVSLTIFTPIDPCTYWSLYLFILVPDNPLTIDYWTFSLILVLFTLFTPCNNIGKEIALFYRCFLNLPSSLQKLLNVCQSGMSWMLRPNALITC